MIPSSPWSGTARRPASPSLVWIHKTPDYVYFNHAVHVSRGISCFECHGQLNLMTRSATRSP